MNIDNGTLTISAAYGIKVPGEADFSSQEARLSLELAFPVEGEYDALVDRAHDLEAGLTTQLKLAVLAQLGLGVAESEDGTISPDFSTLPKRSTAKSSNGGGAYRGGGGGGKGNGGGGGTQRSKPKVDPSDIPTFEVEIDGQSLTVQDLRDIKDSGIYKPTAPDFRVGDNGYWLVDKEGNVNAKTQRLAEAVDAVKPFEAKPDAY